MPNNHAAQSMPPMGRSAACVGEKRGNVLAGASPRVQALRSADRRDSKPMSASKSGGTSPTDSPCGDVRDTLSFPSTPPSPSPTSASPLSCTPPGGHVYVLGQPTLQIKTLVLTGTGVGNTGLSYLACLPWLCRFELCHSDRVSNTGIQVSYQAIRTAPLSSSNARVWVKESA